MFASLINLTNFFAHLFTQEKAALYNLIAFSWFWVDWQYVLYHSRGESHFESYLGWRIHSVSTATKIAACHSTSCAPSLPSVYLTLILTYISQPHCHTKSGFFSCLLFWASSFNGNTEYTTIVLFLSILIMLRRWH